MFFTISLIFFAVLPRPRVSYLGPEDLLRISRSVPDRVPAGTVFYRGNSLDDTLLVWDFIGPRPILNEYWSGNDNASGRVTAIAVDPTNPNVVYVGGAQGGIWKSTDGGNNWNPITDNLSSLATGSIAIFPQNTDIIYYGTGEQNFSGDSYYGDGFFVSHNGGITWTKTAEKTTVGGYIARVLVDPNDSNIVHIVSDMGYLRSLDGGYTWDNTLNVNWGTDLVLNPNSPNILIAALKSSGLWMSTDTGSTWIHLTNGLPSSGFQRINLAISPSNPSVIYASFIANNGSLYGMYKTTDGGSTWTLLPNTPNYVGYQGWYDNCVIVDPQNPNIVYAGGVFPYGSNYYGVIKSTDGGNSWIDITMGNNGVRLHPDQHTLAFGSDGTLFVGNDGGVWKSTDGGDTWINLNATLGVTQFYTVSISPDMNISSPDDILGGTQDNGAVYWSGSVSWTQRASGDGGPVVYEWDSPNIYYTTYVVLTNMLKWDNGILLGEVTGPWQNQGDRVSWCNAPFITDPNQPNTLYAGTHRVWKTTNSGNSWSTISNDLTAGQGHLRALAVAHGNSNIIVSGSSDGRVYITKNGGSSWNRIDQNLFGGNAIPDIWINPSNIAQIYLCVDKASGGRIYMSNDTGNVWIDITGDFPEGIRAQSLGVDFSVSPPVLYLGTDYGAWISINNGSHWFKQTGVPNVAVYDIAIQTNIGKVALATHGRGMWMSDLLTGVQENQEITFKEPLVYPTIVRKSFVVNAPSKTTLRIFNSVGQLVSSSVIPEGYTHYNTKNLKSGVYSLLVGNRYKKIIVIK